jgi:hypothetical protein
MVELDGDTEFKAGRFEPQIEPTGSCEQADYARYWH